MTELGKAKILSLAVLLGAASVYAAGVGSGVKVVKPKTPALNTPKVSTGAATTDRQVTTDRQTTEKPSTSVVKVDPVIVKPIKTVIAIDGTRTIAATSASQPTSVIVKWVVDGDWLPTQGFNLYRKGLGDAGFAKIAGPIRQKSLGVVNLPDAVGAMRQVDLGAMQSKASAAVSIPSAERRIFEVRPAKVASSRPAFDEMRTLRKKVYTPYTGASRQSFSTVDLGAFDKYVAYQRRFNAAFAAEPVKYQTSGNASSAQRSNTKQTVASLKVPSKSGLSPAETTMNARRTLILGSLVNRGVSEGLGLQYVDTNVQTGKTYEYQVRPIGDSGAEMLMAASACSITVGADPTPRTPAGLVGCQTGVKRVELRWDLDESEDAARVISYDIFRIAGGQRKQVNGQPIMVGPVEDRDGQLTDPITYYTDSVAPLGAVKYELVGRDAFDRRTQPIATDVTVADVETPTPVAKTKCTLYEGSVYVAWTPSAKKTETIVRTSGSASGAKKPVASAVQLVGSGDTEATYNVWRRDSEVSPSAWTKLNSNPLPYVKPAISVSTNGKVTKPTGGFVDTTAQKDHYYLYRVTALYPRNSLEAEPSPEEQVGVPDTAKPAAPASLTGTFTAIATKPSVALQFDRRLSLTPKVMTAAPARVRNLHRQPSDWKFGKAVKPKTAAPVAAVRSTAAAPAMSAQYTAQIAGIEKSVNGFAKATLANSALGGKVTLTWTPSQLKAPVRYLIFRADGTGYGLVGLGNITATGLAPVANKVTAKPKVGSATVSAQQTTPVAAAGTANANRHMLAQTGPNAGARLVQSGLQRNSSAKLNFAGRQFEYFKRIDPAALADRAWTFIAETDKPTFDDYLPRSRPVYYNYKVIAVNRWGVEGAAKTVSVRVPSTIPPPTPTFLTAIPNLDGGVTVTWKALENKEECAKYTVYRKPVDISQFLGIITFTVDLTENVSDGAQGSSTPPRLAMGAAPNKPKVTNSAAQTAQMGSMMSVKPGVVRLNSSSVRKLDSTMSATAKTHGVMNRATVPQFDSAAAAKLRKELVNATGYVVAGEVNADQVNAKGEVVFIDSNGLQANAFYSYTIVAEDVDTWRSESSNALMASPFRVKAEPVRNLKATIAASKRAVTLSWAAPIVSGSHKIVGYFVKRGKAGSGSFMQISDQITEVTWTDYGMLRGPAYTYQVYSIDEAGNLSDPVSVDFTASE